MSSHVITKGNVNPENGELYPPEYAPNEGSPPNELEAPEEQQDPNTIPGTTVTLSDDDAEVVGGEEVAPAPVAPQQGEPEEGETPPAEEPPAEAKASRRSSSSE